MAVGAAANATQDATRDATQAGQPYRVGDNVPEIISSRTPVYTELARRARVSGTVIVEGGGKGASRLDRSMEANPQDFQHLEVYRAQLQAMLDAARQAAQEQAAMAKQDATQRLNDLLVEGRKLVTFLRGGVKQRYGDKSEKLVELDLAPVRPKAKSSTDAAKPPAPTPPPTSSHPTTA